MQSMKAGLQPLSTEGQVSKHVGSEEHVVIRGCIIDNKLRQVLCPSLWYMYLCPFWIFPSLYSNSFHFPWCLSRSRLTTSKPYEISSRAMGFLLVKNCPTTRQEDSDITLKTSGWPTEDLSKLLPKRNRISKSHQRTLYSSRKFPSKLRQRLRSNQKPSAYKGVLSSGLDLQHYQLPQKQSRHSQAVSPQVHPLSSQIWSILTFCQNVPVSMPRLRKWSLPPPNCRLRTNENEQSHLSSHARWPEHGRRSTKAQWRPCFSGISKKFPGIST